MFDENFLREDLIDLRKRLGLTQTEMADRLDMSIRDYQAIESGESPYRYIHRLAAERVALQLAVGERDPSLLPDAIRDDVMELAELIAAARVVRPPRPDEVVVHGFRSFDINQGEFVASKMKAPEDWIELAHMGLEPGTAEKIDRSLLGQDGLYRPKPKRRRS